jgi:crossover junction endodeoxyribonuclease RusA
MTIESFKMTVYGHPEPQGSSRAFTPKGWKRPVITSSNPKLKSWRQEIAKSAVGLLGEGRDILFAKPSAVSLTARFYFQKPVSAPKKVTQKTTKPDCDKLARGLADALTGIVYTDDAQIVELRVEKLFGTPERTEIEAAIKG